MSKGGLNQKPLSSKSLERPLPVGLAGSSSAAQSMAAIFAGFLKEISGIFLWLTEKYIILLNNFLKLVSESLFWNLQSLKLTDLPEVVNTN